MKRGLRILLAVFAAVAILCADQSGQSLFQQALTKERAEADPAGAIRIYERVVKEFGKDRKLAAEALFRIGECHQALGDTEARRAFERLVREFSDQTEVVSRARTKLAALTTAEREPKFTRIRVPTKLPNSDATAPLSPDGRQLAYVAGGGVWLLPVHGPSDPDIAGAPRRITEPVRAWEACQDIVWSQDGNWLALNIVERSTDGNDRRSFYLVRAATGESRRLSLDGPQGSTTLHDPCLSLSPDGNWLAYTNWQEINGPRSVCLVSTSGGIPRQLSQQVAAEPSFSPNGKRIAYLVLAGVGERPRPRGREVWVVPVAGGAPALLYRLEGPGILRGPTWSPDGKIIAFLLNHAERGDLFDEMMLLPVSEEGRPSASPTVIKLPQGTWRKPSGWSSDNRIGLLIDSPVLTALYSVPASGGKAVQLTPKLGAMPAWTPDGKRICFIGSALEKPTPGGIEFIPADGGNVTGIPVRGPYPILPGYPSISPDGKQILFMGRFASAAAGQPMHMFTVPIEGGEVTEIAMSVKWFSYPRLSPDGKSFAFVVNPEAKQVWDIYTMSPTGGEPKKLTTESDQCYWAPIAWSPDGSTIAFHSKDGKIKLLSVTGGPTRAILEGLADDNSDLAWSPDGKELAYVSKEKIFTVSLEDGKTREIQTGLDAAHRQIAWSPDGRTIAFSATQGGEPELWLMSDFLPLDG